MEKRKILPIICILLMTSFNILFYAEAEKNEIILDFHFDEPKLRKLQIENETYDRIIIHDLPNLNDAGKPRLPFKPIKVLLPQKHRVKSITVSFDERILIGSGYKIEIAEYPHPFSVKNELHKKFDYNPSDIFPPSLYSSVGTYAFRGFEIIVLKIYPVQYVQKSGELYYYPHVQVIIETEEDSKINPLFRNLTRDKEIVRNMVVNPQEVLTYKNFIPYKRGLCNSSENYEYVIITSQQMAGYTGSYSFYDLINSKIAKGINATIVTVEEIVNESGYWNTTNPLFNDTQAKIRNFIRDAYFNWGTDYILLGGDADDSGSNIVPARDLWVESWAGGYTTYMPSDIYYACLDGNFNSDEDNRWGEPTDGNGGDVDLMAEVYVGRACIDSFSELSNFVMKTLSYENSSGEYIKNVIMSGEYLGFGGTGDWGGNYKDEMINESNANGYYTKGIPENLYNISTLYDKSGIMKKISVDISSYVSNISDAKIAFVLKADNDSTTKAGFYIDDVEIIADGEQIFFDDMDGNRTGGTGNWTHWADYGSDEWENGVPLNTNPVYGGVPHSGTKCWATDLDNTYESGSYQWLVSPSINMSGKNSIILNFYAWYVVEYRDGSYYDYVGIHIYDGSEWIKWVAQYTGCSGWKKQDLIDRIDANSVHLINHLGHANTYYNLKMSTSDVDSLTNDKYFFVYSQGCYAGAFDANDCIAEHFVCGQSGAFAVIMNARYGWGVSYSTDGPSQRYDREFWDAVYGEGIKQIGKANQDSKEDNLWRIDESCMRWCYYELNLFGDPEISIKDAIPDYVYVDDDFNSSTSGWQYDHFASIQDGINAVAENGTVYVYNGTYYENVIVNKTVDLIGENKNTTIVDGNGSGDVFYVMADGVNISRFTIRNGGEEGIYVVNASGCIVSEAIIIENGDIGILLNNSNNNEIKNCIIYNNTYDGILLEYSDYNEIAENTVYWNGIGMNGEGILLMYSNYCIIRNNTVFENGESGIILEPSSSYNNVSYNNAYGNMDCGILISTSSNLNFIYSNTVWNNTYDGILVETSNGNIIMGNNISGNNEDGIFVLLANNCTFTRNYIINNSGYGIYLTNSSNNLIYNNYFNNSNNAWDNGINTWNISKQAGTNILGGDWLGGNFWSNYNGMDANGDGLGDTDLPYNNSGDIQNGGDWLPLVIITNHVPSANNDYYETDEDTTLIVNAPGVLGNDTDADGDALQSFMVNDTNHGLLTLNSNGSFVYIPDSNYHGTDSFTYRAYDGKSYSNIATVYITVNSINDAPVAINDYASLDEDVAVLINILSNDYDIDGSINESSVNITLNPSHGNATINANGTVTYEPDANYYGNDSFRYKVKDNEGAWSNSAEVNITVLPVNDNPFAVNDYATVYEDEFIFINISQNDYDIDGSINLSSILIVVPPSHGSLQSFSNGSVKYIPDANYNGNDEFNYTIEDNEGSISNIATVFITILPVNDMPVAINDHASVDEDSLNSSINVLANDYDIDNDTLVITSVSMPMHGIAYHDGNFIYYTPDENYYGTDLFNYTITDGNATDNATVYVNVSNIPDAPVANFTYIIFDLTVNFTDLSTDNDGDIINWTWNFGDGNISYEQNVIHEYSEYGIYNVTLTVKDSTDLTDEITKQIIFEINDPPAPPYNPYPDGVMRVPVNSSLRCTVYDIDNDTMDVYFYWANGTLIGIVENVSSGEDAEIYPALNEDTYYEWYAVAYDGEFMSSSPIWSFGTTAQIFHFVYGHCWYGNESFPAVEINVTIINECSGESVNTTTDSYGFYSINLGGFNGPQWAVGTPITVVAEDENEYGNWYGNTSLEIPYIGEWANITLNNFILHEGWNLITLPFENSYTASSLFSIIPCCQIILGWNASLQDFDLYVPGSPYDFPIEDGHGYLIGVSERSAFSVIGSSIENVSVILHEGWNMLGWFKENDTMASSIYENITSCSIVLKWNASMQDFDLYVPGSPNDFVIARGDGFLVAVSEQSIWHGEG